MEGTYKVVSRWKSDTHKDLAVNWNGYSFHLIYGKQVNGGFCCVPDWGVGCELATFTDVFWNSESIGRAFKNKKIGYALARIIADEEGENKIGKSKRSK